jgi:hypothetical protein
MESNVAASEKTPPGQEAMLRRPRTVALILVAAIVALWVWWCVPKLFIRSITISPKLPLDKQVELGMKRFELEDRARGTLTQAIGGAVVFLTVYVSFKSMQATKEGQVQQLKIEREELKNSQDAQEEQARIARSGQITDRFTKAIDQLSAIGDENITKRLGGIYALERIARDSPDDHWTIMEVLTTYVRQYAPRKEAEQADPKPISKDIQAILTVLGRRERGKKYIEKGPLDLRFTSLYQANLTEAVLSGANLSGANLGGAVLTGAVLSGANLSGGANLTGAHLSKANLSGAVLTGANLIGAVLIGANLIGANLTGAKNLTQEQLDPAITDDLTRVSPPLHIGPKANAPTE